MIALTYSCGHTGTIAAPNDGGGACHAPKPCPDCWAPPTVKQADLFGNIHDTRQTETQLNGWTIDGAPAERLDRRRGRSHVPAGQHRAALPDARGNAVTTATRRPSNTRARVLFYCRAALHDRCSGRLHSTDTGQDYRCTCECHQEDA